MKTLLITLFIVGLNASAATDNAKDCTKEENYPVVTKAELKKMIADKSAFIIDVNSEKSFAKEHIPGAVHYTMMENTFAPVLPKDKNTLIVAYCGGPKCTAWKKAAEKACALGYTNIKHFKEGITGWKKKS